MPTTNASGIATAIRNTSQENTEAAADPAATTASPAYTVSTAARVAAVAVTTESERRRTGAPAR